MYGRRDKHDHVWKKLRQKFTNRASRASLSQRDDEEKHSEAVEPPCCGFEGFEASHVVYPNTLHCPALVGRHWKEAGAEARGASNAGLLKGVDALKEFHPYVLFLVVVN